MYGGGSGLKLVAAVRSARVLCSGIFAGEGCIEIYVLFLLVLTLNSGPVYTGYNNKAEASGAVADSTAMPDESNNDISDTAAGR